MASLDYERCTIPELQKFIHVRTGVTPRPRQKKAVYLRTVRELDNLLEFRFLDLPAEMRNMVYVNLLVSSNDQKRRPQILQTCKQVHGEAEAILYDTAIFHIGMSYFQYPRLNTHGPIVSEISVCLNNRPFQTLRSYPLTKLSKVFVEWPSWLCKARRLHVTAKVSRVTDVKRLADLQHLLYSLSSYMASNEPLKSMEMTLQGAQLVQPAHRALTRSVVWPIRMIRRSCNLTVRVVIGFAGHETIFEMLEPEQFDMGGSMLPPDTLQDGLRKLATVSSKVKAISFARGTMGMQNSKASALDRLLLQVKGWDDYDDFLDAGLHVKLKEALEEMEVLLKQAISFG